MKPCKLFFMFLFIARLGSAQDFASFLNRVNSLPDSSQQAVVDSFVAVMPSEPIVEQDSIAHFVFIGNAGSVSMAGDVNDWMPNVSPMTNIHATNLWYLTQTYQPDARLEYKIVINGSDWVLDPRNPNQIMEGFGPNSELRMPGYVAPTEIAYYSDIPHGSKRDTTWYSQNLGNQRKVEIYLPAAYSTTSDSFPAIYFQDGTESVSLGKFENVLDYLIEKKMMRPVMAVFVSYVNRTPEYAGNQVNEYMNYFVKELVPFVDSTFRTLREPEFRAVAGASYGGNISLQLGYTYPNIFGNVAAQSSYVEPELSSRFKSGDKLGLKVYMDIGTYDIPGLIPMVHNMVQTLQSRSYNYEYYQYDEGHAWGNWRAHIKNALEFFFPPILQKMMKK